MERLGLQASWHAGRPTPSLRSASWTGPQRLQGRSIVWEIFQHGVKVHIIYMGLIENTLTGGLILILMLAFAEYERDMSLERTQTGKRVAWQNSIF